MGVSIFGGHELRNLEYEKMENKWWNKLVLALESLQLCLLLWPVFHVSRLTLIQHCNILEKVTILIKTVNLLLFSESIPYIFKFYTFKILDFI